MAMINRVRMAIPSSPLSWDDAAEAAEWHGKFCGSWRILVAICGDDPSSQAHPGNRIRIEAHRQQGARMGKLGNKSVRTMDIDFGVGDGTSLNLYV